MSGAAVDRVSVGALRRRAAATLRAAGIESAELDARVLLAHVLGVRSARLLAEPEAAVQEDAAARFDAAVVRRAAGEPVARIVGVKEFWSRDFALSPEVLVPRPETETVVEAALKAKPERDASLRVLDLGTGTGALLGAILLERPRASGTGVDRSEGALAVARRNLDSLGVGARARLVAGDWAAAIDSAFDLIVVNPPYIAGSDIPRLAREVSDHDPRLALDGGADGLDAYRAIVADLPRLLGEEGVAVLELGDGQEGPVATLARSAQLFVNGTAYRDLSGKARALVLSRAQRKKTLGGKGEPH